MDYFKYLIFISVSLLTLSCGLQLKYQNPMGLNRPKNPKYTICDIDDLASLDTIPFIVSSVYENYIYASDDEVIRDLFVFSTDGRFANISLNVEEPSATVKFKEDPWLTAYQVGFYEVKGDTINLEYFANFSWGTYYTMTGVVEKDELNIVGTWQGLGKTKIIANMPYRKHFKKVAHVIVLYNTGGLE